MAADIALLPLQPGHQEASGILERDELAATGAEQRVSSNLRDHDTRRKACRLIHQRKHSLQNRANAYEHHQQLEKIC